VAVLLTGAFLVGGASAELGVRAHRAIAGAGADREPGPAAQLVALELRDASGEVVARPRLIAPAGRAAELVLHDPEAPDTVKLAFRVESQRERTGEIALAYALWVPGHALATHGRVSLVPGVAQSVELEGGALVASWLAVDVPSHSRAFRPAASSSGEDRAASLPRAEPYPRDAI
jgi:hypothetical protein